MISEEGFEPKENESKSDFFHNHMFVIKKLGSILSSKNFIFSCRVFK